MNIENVKGVVPDEVPDCILDAIPTSRELRIMGLGI